MNQINDEYTFEEILERLSKFKKIVSSNLIKIFFISAMGGICGYFYAISSKPKYRAELRFVVKSEGSGVSGIGLLGGLGTVLGGGSSSPLERTIEIASSDRIVGSALLSKVNYDSKNDILANILITIVKRDNELKMDPNLSSVTFSSADSSIERMSFMKRKAIKYLEAILIPKSGNGIISRSIDKKTGVVTLAATYYDEEFAIVLTKAVFEKLRNFYVEQMVASPANNVQILQEKVDSLAVELRSVQRGIAKISDQSNGLLFNEDKVEIQELNLKEKLLFSMYSEAQKNLETFKFMNDSAIPTLTVIDMPFSPLNIVVRNSFIYSLIGIASSFIFVLFILFLIEWFRKIGK